MLEVNQVDADSTSRDLVRTLRTGASRCTEVMPESCEVERPPMFVTLMAAIWVTVRLPSRVEVMALNAVEVILAICVVENEASWTVEK